MIFSKKQLRIFKDAKQRTWYAQNRLREPYIKQFRNVLKNHFVRMSNTIKNAYSNRSLIELDTDLRKHSDQLRKIFRVQYTVIGNAFKDTALGRFFSKDFDADFDRKLDEFIDTETAIWVTEIDQTTRNRIAKVIDNSYNDGLSTDATGTALRNAIIGMGVYRANLIARTETHRVASFANETVAESMNIRGTQKEWVAIQDARTRITHSFASGQSVPLEGNFLVGGSKLKYPGDPKGSPSETINCRCAVIYTTPDFL
jgi:uncharacterized protein with gpF-like domain